MEEGTSQNFQITANNVFGPLGLPGYNISPNSVLNITVKLVEIVNEDNNPPGKIENIKDEAMKLKDMGNLVISKEPESAKSYYLKAIELFNSTHLQDKENEKFLVPFYLNIAACDIKMGNCQSALDNCYRVLRVDEKNAKAYYRCGEVYEKCNKLDYACWHYKQSDQHTPSSSTKSKINAMNTKSKQAKAQKQMFAGMFVNQSNIIT